MPARALVKHYSIRDIHDINLYKSQDLSIYALSPMKNTQIEWNIFDSTETDQGRKSKDTVEIFSFYLSS